MSLESPAVLSHLSSWLTCIDLYAVRILNRWFYNEVPRQTWELTACHISSLASVKHLLHVYTRVWHLRIQDAFLNETASMESLAPWFDGSLELRELELTRVSSVSGFDVHLLAEKITKVIIRQCHQVQEPAIIAPKIITLIIEQCPVTRFHVDTSLPQLEKLLLSSRSFTTLQFRNLITELLPKSPALKKLSLAGCSQLEQVRVDSCDLPALHQLDISKCPRLNRVHVTSKQLDTLVLSPNISLQVVVLDLKRTKSLDLSFLKNLMHLSIRSPSLRRLDLRGCDQLVRYTTDIDCPNLRCIILQGTTLTVADINRNVFGEESALPDSR